MVIFVIKLSYNMVSGSHDRMKSICDLICNRKIGAVIIENA